MSEKALFSGPIKSIKTQDLFNRSQSFLLPPKSNGPDHTLLREVLKNPNNSFGPFNDVFHPKNCIFGQDSNSILFNGVGVVSPLTVNKYLLKNLVWGVLHRRAS